MLPEIPLPTKIRTAFQEPIELDSDPERTKDDDYIEDKYEEVRSDPGRHGRAGPAPRFPIFGEPSGPGRPAPYSGSMFRACGGLATCAAALALAAAGCGGDDGGGGNEPTAVAPARFADLLARLPAGEREAIALDVAGARRELACRPMPRHPPRPRTAPTAGAASAASSRRPS